MPVLSMEAVHFRRGDAAVLSGIDWRVRPGQHWAVLGPNGSGKTSLIMIAAGYLPASRGRVFLLEGYISRIVLPEVRRRIGLVSSTLADAMLTRHARATGLEIVLSGLYASLGVYERPAPQHVERAGGILEQLGAAHLEEVPFLVMSAGQRQMCMIGRCYMARSELVILDEPCAGLDIGARETVLAALARACVDGHAPTHIFITHHPSEIVPGITHVLLMSGGRAIAQGRRDDVLTAGNLSAAYGIAVRIEHDKGRVWVRPI